MTTALSLLLLPLRAPLLLLLLLISVYLGLHWSRPGSWADAGLSGVTDLIWSAECLQALIVVVVCTMPDLLLRRLSAIMAASRVASLVITLLLVVTGGLYLLHLEVLSNVLILASSVLLARLDLVRLRVVPPPFVMTLVLSVLVLGGISLGRMLQLQLRPYVTVPRELPVPAQERRAQPRTRSRATRSAQDPSSGARESGASMPSALIAPALNPAPAHGGSHGEPNSAIPSLPTSSGAPAAG